MKHSLSCLQSLSKVGAIFLSVPRSSYIKEIHGQDMSQGWAYSPNLCHNLISEERDEELGKCQTLSRFVCGHLRPFTIDCWISWPSLWHTHSPGSSLPAPLWRFLLRTIDQPPFASPRHAPDVEGDRVLHLLVTSAEGGLWRVTFPVFSESPWKQNFCLVRCSRAEVKGRSDNSYFEGHNLVSLSQAIKDCLTPEIAGWGSCSNSALCGSWRRCSVVTAPPELCKNPSKEIPILASFPLSVSFPIPLYLFLSTPCLFCSFFVQIIHLLII